MYFVWLFFDGCFQSVGVDGWFFVDQFGDEDEEYLWLLVMVKCIRKVVQSKGTIAWDKLTPHQIYNMLTGLTI